MLLLNLSASTYRAYPDEWQLSMPKTIGFPKILVQQKEMPTLEELNEAFRMEKEAIESDTSFNPFNLFK